MARFTVCLLWFGTVCFPAQAAFTSLFVFGDGVCTTTNGPGGSWYYGNRYSNGRVWVEVLADRQGLGYDSNKNWSYFGHYSYRLVTNLNSFPPPTNANTALFVVWVNNADFVENMGYTPYTMNNLAAWTNAINRSLNNHWKAITNLYYAKGARTLIMPNAVDITRIPQYAGLEDYPDQRNFIRQRVLDFNTAFAAILNQARMTLPGIMIYEPDAFAFLNDVLAHPPNYGLTNALYNGHSVGASYDPALANKSLNGPGTNYIFWDYWHPTAKFHAHVANYVQQLIWPARISHITSLNGSNRLDVTNIPIGRNGPVEGSTNLLNWTAKANINSTNATQTVYVPASNPIRFYRLRFPFAWSWP